MRLKRELVQLLTVVAVIALSNAVPLNRFDSDGNNLHQDRRNVSLDHEFNNVCVVDDVLYQIGDFVPPTNPCERCICESPTIACSPLQCDFKPNCKALKMSDQCCTVYQCECEHNGRVYQNGERLETPENPCDVCYCRGGEVSCTTIECYRRDDCEPQYVSGRCCPKYDHCPPIDQPRLEKTRPQFIRTDINRDTTASVDPTVQQRNGFFDLDNEASEDVTATAVTTDILEQRINLTATEGDWEKLTMNPTQTDASVTLNLERHNVYVKHNIGDGVHLTADHLEQELTESRKVPSITKLIPVTEHPVEDNIPSTTSLYNEEGSGTTFFNLNEASSSTESNEAGSGTKLKFDITVADEEGSGAEEPEIQTEANFPTTLSDNNPQVRIISESTSESEESNEVVTGSTTLDYSGAITRKQLPESTKLAEELTTVTENPEVSPIEGIITESFIINVRSNTDATSESREVETVTEQEKVQQTDSSEESKTTSEGVTESNELGDNAKTTARYVKLRTPSVEFNFDSKESKVKESISNESPVNDVHLKSATLTNQDIGETTTDASVDVTNPADVTPMQDTVTTLVASDEVATSVLPDEAERVKIISSISAVKIFMPQVEKEFTIDQAPQESATESSFTNLDNELPVLPIGSVLINNEMAVVLATTESVETTHSEETSVNGLLHDSTEETLTTETATEETSTEHILGLKGIQRSSLNQDETDEAGSNIFQKMVLEIEAKTDQTPNSSEITTTGDEITTVMPTIGLRKLSPLLNIQSLNEATDTVPFTTTEVTLQDGPTESNKLSTTINSKVLVQERTNLSDEDLTTMSSELEEITAVTESTQPRDTEGLAVTTSLEESSTALPSTEDFQVIEQTNGFSTEESTATFTEAPKLARTVLGEESNSHVESEPKESGESTTEHSFIETTTDKPEDFVSLSSDASSINEDTASSESTGTTKSESEDATQQTERAMLREALSGQSEFATDQSAEVTTTGSPSDQETSNTNNDNIRTEVYQQDATITSNSEEDVTEQIELKQRSDVNDNSVLSDFMLNDSSDVSASQESTTQYINAEEVTTKQPEETEKGKGIQALESTSSDEHITEEPEEDGISTSSDITGTPSIETSTLATEQSEKKESFSEFEETKPRTASSEESVTTLSASTLVDKEESSTQYSAEETTTKAVDSTVPPPSSTSNIKREISILDHTSILPEQGTEVPTTSKIFPNDYSPQQRAADDTEDLQSSEEVTTEISNFSQETSEKIEKLELTSLKQEETYTSIPEQSTTQETSILEDSTQQSAESSTKLYIEDVTNNIQESGLKKEILARVVHSSVVSEESNQNDSEVELTTLPRVWLKSDDISDMTKNPDLTTETVTGEETKEYATSVTESQQSLVTEGTTDATTLGIAEEEKSASASNERNSTNTTEEDQNTGTTNLQIVGSSNTKEQEHHVQTRSVDDFDINSGNDNSFIRPEHASSYVRDPNSFPFLDDFFTRLFHHQDLNREEELQ